LRQEDDYALALSSVPSKGEEKMHQPSQSYGSPGTFADLIRLESLPSVSPRSAYFERRHSDLIRISGFGFRHFPHACSMLAAGKRRVCCFGGCGFYCKSLSAPESAN